MPTATKKPAPKKATAKKSSPVNGRGDLGEGGFAPYPAILVQTFEGPNATMETGQEQQENGNWQLLMLFERCDKQWSDGNPVMQFVRATTWFSKSDEAAGPGSEADVISASFAEATDGELDVLSDSSLASFIGHAFMLQDEDSGREYTDKQNKTRKVYITSCVEYLGDDYTFDGTVKVVSAGGSSNGNGKGDFDPAAYMASLFDGQTIEDLKAGEAMNLVKGDDQLAEVKSVLGKPTRGGVLKPKAALVDLLIENGYATDEDGVFTVAE